MTQSAVLAASGSPGTTTGFKNRIINGNMVISQRGTSGTTSVLQTGTFMTDRWSYYVDTTGYFNWAQNLNSVTPPAGFTNYLGFSSTGNNTISTYAGQFFYQTIEGYNIADLGWGTANAKSCTLSFWVYSSLTGTFGGVVRAGNNSQQYAFNYTISAANTWQQITVTVPGPTSGGTTAFNATNGLGLAVVFSLGAGGGYVAPTPNVWSTGTNYVTVTGATQVCTTSGATFYLTGVQFEAGTTATNFDFRSYGTELALCQRYYESNASAGQVPANGLAVLDGYKQATYTAGELYLNDIYFQVAKRATPTITYYRAGQNATNGTWAWYSSGWQDSATTTTDSAGTHSFGVLIHNTTGANLTVQNSYITQGVWAASAEL